MILLSATTLAVTGNVLASGAQGATGGSYEGAGAGGAGGTGFLAGRTVTVTAGAVVEARGTLRSVVPPGWVAADLHLHSSPSPDSRVTLAERVGSLVCNGIDFAVATDHNRITDLRPAVRAPAKRARGSRS